MDKKDGESDLEEVLSNYDENPDDNAEITADDTNSRPNDHHAVTVSEPYNDKNMFDFNVGVDESPILSVRSTVSHQDGNPERDGLKYNPQSDHLENGVENSAKGDNKDNTFSPPLSVREDTLILLSDTRSSVNTTGAEPLLKRLSIPVLNLTTVISPLSPQSLTDDDDTGVLLTEEKVLPAIPVPALKHLSPSQKPAQRKDRSHNTTAPSLKLSDKRTTKNATHKKSGIGRADVLNRDDGAPQHGRPVRKPERTTPDNKSKTAVKPAKVNEGKMVPKATNQKRKLERKNSFPEEVQTRTFIQAATAEKQTIRKEVRKADVMRNKPESENVKAQAPETRKRLSRSGIPKEKQSKKAAEAKSEDILDQKAALSENRSSKGNRPNEVTLDMQSRLIAKQDRKRMAVLGPKKSLNSTYTIGQADDTLRPINVRLRQLSVRLPKFPSKRTSSKRQKWTRSHAVVPKVQQTTQKSLDTKTLAPVYSLGENLDDNNEGDTIRLDKSLQRLVDFTVNDANHPPQDSYLLYLENSAVAYRNSADKIRAGNDPMSHADLTQIKNGIFLESSQQELNLYDILLTDTAKGDSLPTGNYLERSRYDVQQRRRRISSKSRRAAANHSRVEDRSTANFDEEIPVIQDGNRNINRAIVAEEKTAEKSNTVSVSPVLRKSGMDPRRQSDATRPESIKEAETELRSRVMRDILKLSDLSPQSLREVMINHFDRQAWWKSNQALDANQVSSILSSIFDNFVLI